MDDAWRKRLRQVIKETPGLSMKALAMSANLDPSTVQKWLKEGKSPTLETFLAVCSAAGVSPGFILEGTEPTAVAVKVAGVAYAGEGFTPCEETRGDTVEFSVRDNDTIAIEVRGDSMTPVYRPGDVLICHRSSGRSADNLTGLDCAVRTKDGDHYIKILRRGSRPGLFTLRSFNPSHDDIEDVQLEWVAPIAWVKRGER